MLSPAAVFYIALMAYVLAFCHMLLSFFSAKKYFKIMANIFLGFGLCVNLYEISAMWATTGKFPSSTLYDFMLLLAAAFAATYFIINFKLRSNTIGVFIVPFPIIFSVLACFAPNTVAPQFVESVWRYGHLPFIILGTTFFIASFFAALMFLILESQLKKKQFGVIFQKFPSLDVLNKLNDMTLKVGFYFFSLGAILGFVWMIQAGSENILASLKIILSLITWGVFAVIIITRLRKGMPPRKMALWTVAGFLSVILTYVGVAVFLTR